MALRSRRRELSFDILATEFDDVMSTATVSRSISDPLALQSDALSSSPRRKKKKKNKKKSTSGKTTLQHSVVCGTSAINGDVNHSCTASTITEAAVLPDVESEGNHRVYMVASPFGELRQRNVGNAVNGGSVEIAIEESVSSKNDRSIKEETAEDVSNVKEVNSEHRRVELNGRKLEKEGTLDWKRLMAEDSSYTLPLEKSPMKYFMEEMYAGNSLRNTTILGNEKERERVYDTIFRLPWRCELLINFGFFVCFDSFLSLLTIMPTRIIITFWKLLKTRQFKRPSSAELSDFGCFIVLVSGVTVLQQADISLIYHMIRGQGIIKLYVVYNVLEVFDKLCQSFGGDVMQALFNSADGLANCSPENMQFWLWRFISDEALAITSSNILLIIILLSFNASSCAQAITLSTCIVAHNNALFAMLVSNNFAEIKSNVFKRYSKDNVQSLNALVVYMCEVMIDIIKHSFIAKFNDIKPIAFSEFLEDLCKQKLNMETENGKKSLLTFVPLAPACVVIRVLRPVYAAHLPYNPLLWRIFWILVLLAMTFVMLASLKACGKLKVLDIWRSWWKAKDLLQDGCKSMRVNDLIAENGRHWVEPKLQQLDLAEGSDTTIRERMIRKRSWQQRIESKLKHFVWKCYSNVNMRQREMLVDVMCKGCVCWDGVLTELCRFRDWWGNLCAVDKSETSVARMQLTTYILWWLWKTRNLWQFENIWRSEQSTVNAVVRAWFEFVEVELVLNELEAELGRYEAQYSG
ncbi:transmembrane anterior posterior transformation protein 1 [Striga asiatica]|uniref:Transmembrane anterior posterior transformation protein 1 n=1 Tax=Striga asiatica TaxID=4170 RepID=A0A5A7PWB7_STRAF|nr:transmembrane anterior posterior transformation protein 1 [Striga asiatica]